MPSIRGTPEAPTNYSLDEAGPAWQEGSPPPRAAMPLPAVNAFPLHGEEEDEEEEGLLA